MADPPLVETLAYCPTLGDQSTTRTLGSLMSTGWINVQDYGAVGDGRDDTAALQLAIDDAFGSWTSPHGRNGWASNKTLFFPPGDYHVRSAVTLSISNAESDGSAPAPGIIGLTKLTVDSISGRLATGDVVNIFGANSTIPVNGVWFITVNDDTHITLNKSEVKADQTYTSGGTVVNAALRIRAARGASILGAGKQASRIYCETTGGIALHTNGFGYSRVQGMWFNGVASGIGFDLNWMANDPLDGTGQSVSTQSVTFVDCQFVGKAYGCTVGMGTAMCSETSFQTCYFGDGTDCDAGLFINCQNAVNNTLFGGNIAGCSKGIWVRNGSLDCIYGVSFQNGDDASGHVDIHIEGGSGDSYAISGCRSETANFALLQPTQPYAITGCSQLAGSSGYFAQASGGLTINSCLSVNGQVKGNADVVINASQFGRADYLPSGEVYKSLSISPMRVTTQTGANYSVTSADGGSKILFDRTDPQTATVLVRTNELIGPAFGLRPGSQIILQQINTGQVTVAGDTGVVIHSSNGLKLRTQWSVATLTCDGENLWTLDGDTTA